MKYTYYYGKGMEVSESLNARAEKKLSKLERYFRSEPEAAIRFKQQSGARNIVEITVSVDGIILRAEECSNDMYLSIDHAVDKLESQVRRHRTKLAKRIRTPQVEEVVEEIPTYMETDYKVVRTKQYAVKPMSVDDAIVSMDMLGHNFFVFVNEDGMKTCVIYRRNDGDIGVLEPEK